MSNFRRHASYKQHIEPSISTILVQVARNVQKFHCRPLPPIPLVLPTLRSLQRNLPWIAIMLLLLSVWDRSTKLYTVVSCDSIPLPSSGRPHPLGQALANDQFCLAAYSTPLQWTAARTQATPACSLCASHAVHYIHDTVIPLINAAFKLQGP